MRVAALCTAALAAVLTTGCAAGPAGAHGSGEGMAPMVTIENHNWSDVNVYAVVNESTYRLGMVTTSDVEMFRLPRVVEGAQVRLRVEVIGSREVHVTAPIQIRQSDRIDFEVMNHLPMSNYMVRVAGVF